MIVIPIHHCHYVLYRHLYVCSMCVCLSMPLLICVNSECNSFACVCVIKSSYPAALNSTNHLVVCRWVGVWHTPYDHNWWLHQNLCRVFYRKRYTADQREVMVMYTLHHHHYSEVPKEHKWTFFEILIFNETLKDNLCKVFISRIFIEIRMQTIYN